MATITTASGLSKKQIKNMWRDMKSVPRRKYDDIEFYKLLRDDLINFYNDSPFVTIKETYMSHSMDYFIYENNSCMIGFGGNYMRFGTRGKSIDISRVNVLPEHHGKGIGTALMDTFFLSFLSLVRTIDNKITIPDIILECFGAVGCGDTYQQTPKREQVRFFQKFGFEVVREDQYGYVHMKLSTDKFFEYVKNNLLKKLTESEKELVTL